MQRKSTMPPKSKVAWTPSDESEQEQVLRELDALTQDDLFRRSNRYAVLLRYIVEKTLAGESAGLKERSIGIDVFKRPNDYDTSADPVVRFCAAEVRRRLAQFYRSNPSRTVEIELPLGSYVPRFLLASTLAEGTVVVPEEPPAQEVHAPYVDIAQPEARPSHRYWRWAVLAVILLVGVGSWQLMLHRTKLTPVEKVWKPLLMKSVSLQLCTGVPMVTGPTVPGQNVSIQQAFQQPGHKISFATASAIAKVSGFLESQGQPFSLTESDAVGIDNLRDHPLVLVNANNNRWTLFLLKPLRYHFDFVGDNGAVVDMEHPEIRRWTVDFSKPYDSQSEDFALVARIQDPTTRSPVLIIAGVGSNGTQAAADFVLSDAAIADLARRAPQHWENMNFEVLLRVEVVDGHLGATRIEETYFW